MNAPARCQVVPAFAGALLRGDPLVVNLNVNVTNLCTQRCPHCNALAEDKADGRFLDPADLERALHHLAARPVPSVSLSGGEPTVHPDLPELLEVAARHCPFGVNLNTNLYGRADRLNRALDAALAVGARIDVSFDGFGDVADRLRGAKDVSLRVGDGLARLVRRRSETGSRSVVTVHTVLNDLNLSHAPAIFRMTAALGVRQTIAPLNRFGYLAPDAGPAARLTDSPLLRQVLGEALRMPHRGQSRAFVRGILPYVQGRAAKRCPYLTPGFRAYKVFLDPDGSATLCDRTRPVGNLVAEPLRDIAAGAAWAEEVRRYRACPGCWMVCFVEPLLRTVPWVHSPVDAPREAA